MTALRFLQTLQLTDSLFPSGSFAFSDGLETAVACGHVRDSKTLKEWLQAYLDDVFTPCEGLAMFKARLAAETPEWETLKSIDRELTALKPAAGARASSISLGQRFLKSCSAIHADPRITETMGRIHRGEMPGNLPVTFGIVFGVLGIETRDAVLAFGYTRLTGTVSASMRLISLGQQQAQAALTTALPALIAAADRIIGSGSSPLTCFAPRLDIHAMNHRYLYSRLFRS